MTRTWKCIAWVALSLVGLGTLYAGVPFAKSAWRKFRHPTSGEAMKMLQSMRIAQESYRAEVGHYAAVSSSLEHRRCPSDATTPERLRWDPTCDGGAGTWELLALYVERPVQFRYTLVAGKAGEMLPAPPTGMDQPVTFGDKLPTQEWFVIVAVADTDGNGVRTTVVATSWSNGIYVDREGE